MFTTNHFIWLGICAVLIIVLLLVVLKKKFSIKVASYIMAIVALISEISKILTHMIDSTTKGMVIDPAALPLHLCSILIFVIFYIAFSKNDKYKDKLISFVVPIGIIGGTLAILIATSGVSFKDPEVYQCFIYHAILVWYALYLIISKQVCLDLRTYFRNVIALLSLAFIMIWVNGALKIYDTNFFFVVRPPADGLPILNLNHGWYIYFLSLVLTGMVLMTLLHLPFIIKSKKIENN